MIENTAGQLDLVQYEREHAESSLLCLGSYPDSVPSASDWARDTPVSAVKSACSLLLHLSNQMALDSSR